MEWNDAIKLSEVCAMLCPFCAGTSKSSYEPTPRFDYRNQFDAQHNCQRAWIHRATYNKVTYWEHVDCKAAEILRKVNAQQ